MLDIYEISMLNILPPNLKQDPDIIAASKVIDKELLLVTIETDQCLFLPRLDSLDGAILDLLAWQMHVDFYDSTLPVETKRSLIKNSDRWHSYKGTPAAVEELITTLFDEGVVEEWFEYSGVPGYFRVKTNNSAVTNEKAAEFIKALDSVKRKSAWLEKVVITQSEELPLYFAGITHVKDYVLIKEA